MSAERLWLALLAEPPAAADAVAAVREGGWLAGWLQAPKPDRAARRADPRILDRRGEAAVISFVLPPRDRLLAFDDVAVQQARRDLLAHAQPPDLVSTLLIDDSRFAGSLIARRGDDAERRLRDDPFARIDPASRRILHIGPGLLGAVPLPAGPGIERHGSGTPWPGGRF